MNRLFAIGDIHGCYDQLYTLISKKLSLKKEDRVVLVGDYIDRGEKSREVIDFIIDLKDKGFDIVTLLGNHESMLLDASENEDFLDNWYMNGGINTLFSFGISSPAELDDNYMRFFRELKYWYSYDRFLFVHAGFNDDAGNPFEDTHQMIWSRRETYSNPLFGDKIIVHGHTPVTVARCRNMAESGSRVINIDTGCVYGTYGGLGYLTAIELNSMELFPV